MEGNVLWTADVEASTGQFEKIDDNTFKLTLWTYHDEANFRFNRSELLKFRDAINIALSSGGRER